MFKYLNRLTELHCEQRHHKFLNHNICKLIHLSSNLFIENPKARGKGSTGKTSSVQYATRKCIVTISPNTIKPPTKERVKLSILLIRHSKDIIIQ